MVMYAQLIPSQHPTALHVFKHSIHELITQLTQNNLGKLAPGKFNQSGF